MFYALARDLIDTGNLTFEHHLSDIETLNRAALEGTYELTAISIHAYAYIDERYALLSSGGSMGEGYGPVVVARQRMALKGRRVAVPGTLTSAYLALRLYEPDFEAVPIPFDRIGPAVHEGEVDAGVLIHEGQLQYESEGLQALVKLGEWWQERTGGLPLPLGGNAVRRDLGADVLGRVAELMRQSIRYALDHRDEALDYALSYARGLERQQADRFVGMYVNERTVDYGEDGREAIRRLLAEGHEKGILDRAVDVEFID